MQCMEIQSIPFPGKEPADDKTASLADIASHISTWKPEAEMEFVVNTEASYQKTTERNDTSEISDESKADTSKEADAVRRIEQLLAKLRIWQPLLSSDSEKELERLKELYMTILKQIVNLTEHDEQKRLLSLLDSYTFGNLAKLVEKHFSTLDGFLHQYGEHWNRTSLFNSLFRSATGRSLPPETVGRLLDEVNSAWNGKENYKEIIHTKNEHEGILYSRHISEKAVPYSKAFSGRKLVEADYLSGTFPEYGKVTDANKLVTHSGPRQNIFFQVQDLQAAETFLTHFLGEGNLLSNTQITAWNPQLRGFLAADTWLKSIVYLQASGIQKTLAGSISRAIDRMMLFYINSAAAQKCTAASSYISHDSASGKENREPAVFDIYCRLRMLCQKEPNAGKALTSILKYAYSQYENQDRKEGFFFAHPDPSKSDCKKGFLLLKKDWRQFVDGLPVSMRRKRELETSFMSPWGDYVSPLNPLYNPEAAHPAIIGGLVTAAVVIVFCLFT